MCIKYTSDPQGIPIRSTLCLTEHFLIIDFLQLTTCQPYCTLTLIVLSNFLVKGKINTITLKYIFWITYILPRACLVHPSHKDSVWLKKLQCCNFLSHTQSLNHFFLAIGHSRSLILFHIPLALSCKIPPVSTGYAVTLISNSRSNVNVVAFF